MFQNRNKLKDGIVGIADLVGQPKYKRNQLRQYKYPLRSKFSTAAAAIMQQELFKPVVNHIYDKHGNRQTLRKLLTGTDKKRWNKCVSMEIGRLAQGNIHGVVHTDTIKFIFKEEIPTDEKVTYAQFVCDHRPNKPELYRVRCVGGGDKLMCEIDAGAPTTNMVEFKLLLNSIISDAKYNARFMSLDLKDFFLATPMEKCKYMKISMDIDIMKMTVMFDVKSQVIVKRNLSLIPSFCILI